MCLKELRLGHRLQRVVIRWRHFAVADAIKDSHPSAHGVVVVEVERQLLKIQPRLGLLALMAVVTVVSEELGGVFRNAGYVVSSNGVGRAARQD